MRFNRQPLNQYLAGPPIFILQFVRNASYIPNAQVLVMIIPRFDRNTKDPAHFATDQPDASVHRIILSHAFYIRTPQTGIIAIIKLDAIPHVLFKPTILDSNKGRIAHN